MPEPVHLLTDPASGLTSVTVVCGARLPERGTWDHRAVTCPACLAPPARVSSGSGLTEKQWLAQVRTLAHTYGWRTYHTLHSRGSESGWIDLVCLKPPVLLLAELKTETGRVTPPQQQWLDGLRQVETVQVHLWRPGEWDQVQEVLR